MKLAKFISSEKNKTNYTGHFSGSQNYA